MIESRRIECGRLALGCHFHRDRHAHTLAIIDGDRLIPLLASCEGSADDPWPPSPPLQSLHTEQRPGGPCLLLVGMVGPNHWSVSIEPRDSELTFDVACRIKRWPGGDGAVTLGSGYRSMVAAQPTSPGQLMVPVADAELYIDSVAPDDYQPAAQLVVTDTGFRVVRLLDRDQPLPVTVRWRFRMALHETAGRKQRMPSRDHARSGADE